MGGKVSSGTVRGTVPDQLGSAVQQLRESGVDVTYCSCGASGLQQFFQGLVQLVELTSHNGRKLTPHVPSNRGERFVWKACGRADHDAHVSSVQHRVKTNFIREGQLRIGKAAGEHAHATVLPRPCKSGVKRRNIFFTNSR